MKLFIHHIFYTDLGQILLFFALFKPTLLQFFTILLDKLNSFNIQDDRSTRFLCTKNIELNWLHYKTFSQRLFRQNNLLLCGMQGNNALLAKTLNMRWKNPKSTIQPASSYLLAPNKQCELLVFKLLNLNRVTLQHNEEFIMFISYLWFC